MKFDVDDSGMEWPWFGVVYGLLLLSVVPRYNENLCLCAIQSSQNNAGEKTKQNAEYTVVATEKVKILKKCKGCNKVDWKIRNSVVVYERPIQKSDNCAA